MHNLTIPIQTKKPSLGASYASGQEKKWAYFIPPDLHGGIDSDSNGTDLQ